MEKKALYLEYGHQILTTAVVAIIITAPAGAIFINTFGPKWLQHDGEIEAVKETNEEKEVELGEVGSAKASVVEPAVS